MSLSIMTEQPEPSLYDLLRETPVTAFCATGDITPTATYTFILVESGKDISVAIQFIRRDELHLHM